MKEILNNIFIENKFRISIENKEYTFYEKKDQEYFFTAYYEQAELSSFFTSKRIEEIINTQEKSSETQEDISKNTSMVIYVKTDNFEDFFKSEKKHIYKIEEDEYYFRKYVIIYTENSIKKIIRNKNILKRIQEILLEPGRMEKFEEEYYKDEEFFLIMQLYIKLSFLNYNHDKENKRFETINQRIKKSIVEQKLSEQTNLINEWLYNDTSNLYKDEEALEEDDYFIKLEKAFLNVVEDEQILLDFMNQLEVGNNEN